MQTVCSYWDLQLNYECPECQEYYDYLQSKDYNDCDGWEGMPNPLEKGKHKIICNCGKEIELDIQEGL